MSVEEIKDEIQRSYRKISAIPPGLYKSLLSQTSVDRDIIRKDVKRVENCHEHLKNVLHAISIYQPIGYCQGLHIIIQFLLDLGYKPETTFIVFDCLLYHPTTNLLSYWSVEFPQLQVDLKLLQHLIVKRCKRLSKLMLEHDIETPMFALRWLLCLFMYDIEDKHMIHFLFLYFLRKGRKALLHTAVAICEQVEDKLKSDSTMIFDLQEIIELLHTSCKHITKEQIRECKFRSSEIMDLLE